MNIEPPIEPPVLPGISWCLVAIAAVRLSLKSRGFERTVKAVREYLDKRQRPDTTVSIEIVRAFAHRVAVAGALFPGRARCLEQALTLYLLLRRAGIGVVFRMGVQPFGFVAHAWIEYNEEPINERGEITRKVAPFPLVLS